MAENSKIEWTTHTFNPWLGCTKISPACDHCYAEGWAKRTGGAALWQGERRRTTVIYWRMPLKWNKAAECATERPRVFCASLADVFDNQVPAEWRSDLWALIRATPNLDWLLLTKRPQNIRKMLPADWCDGYSNVWLGTTVENKQELFRRGNALKDIPARVRFWSCEPLLEDLGDLTPWLTVPSLVDWIICGGESGPGARLMHPDWARSLRDQCETAGVAFHFKQWGDWAPDYDVPSEIAEEREIRGTGDHFDGQDFYRMGKKAAGRLLDGIEHNGIPGGTS